MITGPWSQPRIYPDMAGVLDNPDAAYAKLREMGKGLFGPNGGLSGILNGLSGLGNGQSGGSGSPGSSDNQGGLLGGKLGETLGNLIQQGLGGEQAHRGRSIRPNSSAQPQAAPAPPPQDDNSPRTQDSQPMNDVLRQLFSR
jgi:AsmA protein